jgi:hypothetical protein
MFNFSLKGVGEWIRLGKNGPIIKKDGDKISYRDSFDSALINVQALDPVDPQDVITKQYFEDNSSNLPFSVSASLFAQASFGDLSVELKGKGGIDLPQNALVYAVQISVTETFNGTNPTASIGTDADDDRLLQLDKNDLQKGNVFYLTLSDIFSTETVIKAFITSNGSTQGAFDATVLYTLSEAEEVGGTPQLLIDQSSANSELTFTSALETYGQTATLANDTDISTINIGFEKHPSNQSTLTGTVVVRIYDSAGGTLLGTSDPVDATTFPPNLSPAFVSFNFSTPVSVSAGEFYFEFDGSQLSASSNNIIIQYSDLNPYAGGRLYYNGNPFVPTWDIQFQVIGIENSNSITLPSFGTKSYDITSNNGTSGGPDPIFLRPNGSLSTINQWAVSIWFKVPSTFTLNTNSYIYTGNGFGSSQQSNTIYLRMNTDGRLIIYFGNQGIPISSYDYRDDQWHNIILNADTTNDVFNYMIDGVKTGDFDLLAFGTSSFNSAWYTVGGKAQSASGVAMSLAQFSTYDLTGFGALSEQQMLEIYNGGVCCDERLLSTSALLEALYTFGDNPSDDGDFAYPYFSGSTPRRTSNANDADYTLRSWQSDDLLSPAFTTIPIVTDHPA